MALNHEKGMSANIPTTTLGRSGKRSDERMGNHWLSSLLEMSDWNRKERNVESGRKRSLNERQMRYNISHLMLIFISSPRVKE